MPSFASPFWLLALPPVFYILWRIHLVSFAEGSSALHRFWLFTRAIVATLLVFALAGFQWKTSVQQKQIIFLLDASGSISPEQHEKALQWINRVIAGTHSPDQVGIVTFGSNAAVERFPTTPRPAEKLETLLDVSATNFEEGATMADALFADSYQQNLVVVSDGNETTGDGKAVFDNLRKKGVSTQALYLPPVDHPEAGVDSLRVPDAITLKQTFGLDVVLSSNRTEPALLQIYRNGQLIQEGTTQLEQGKKQTLQLPQKLEAPGLYRYQVVLKPSQDFKTDNNNREVWVQIAGPPRILLADEQPEQLRSLEQALVNRGFEVELKHAQDFPLSLQDMLLYQAIFIRNIPASQIHDQMPLLREYVQNFGGGFAMLGGKQSFGPGGYYKTPVEEILPVTMDLQNKKYLADVAMVIVIDKSGSMSYADRGRQKIDLADEGGARIASLLRKSDQFGVLAVDSVPKWAFPLQRLSDLPAAIEAATSIRAGGGGIYVYSGLREAYESLRTVEASVKHVILFADTADCEEKEGATGESSLMLARRALERENITTTTIGIGQKGDGDVQFLEDLASIGKGRFYFTNDMFTLPEIFSQESAIVQRFYINEERFTPVIREGDPVLAGISAVPDLLAYVATSPKPASTRGIISHKEDPVLATWRTGLGQTLAFTSAPTVDWAAPWMDWPDYERFWAQAARFVARSTEPAHFESSFVYNGNRTTVIVDAQDERGDFLNGSQFQGVFLNAAGETQRVPFTQISPGRYEAPLQGTGARFGKIFRVEAGTIVEEAVVQTPAATGNEYDSRPFGREKLKEIAGSVYDTPEQLKFTNKASHDVRSLRDRLLLLAAFLFLLDVAVRKISLRDLKPTGRKPTVATAGVSTPMQQLKTRKQSVVNRYAIEELPPPEPKENLRTSTDSAVEPPQAPAPESSEYMKRLKDAKRRKKED